MNTSLKELKAISFSLAFLSLAFLSMWFLKDIMQIDRDTVYVAVLLIPALVYMIVSGRITEFKGPGGLAAKFAEAAKEAVSAASEKVEPSIEQMQTIAKDSRQELERKRREINESRPIIMTMTLGKTNYYNRVVVLDYIEVLSQFRNFKFVVFVDGEGRFVAYMPSWAVKGLLSKPELGNAFIEAINRGSSEELFSYPGVVKDTISTQSTNAEALREMTKQNLEALVVIDEKRGLKGVVERDQVLSKMMLALTQ